MSFGFLRVVLPWAAGAALLATACTGNLTPATPTSPPPDPTATSSSPGDEVALEPASFAYLPSIADVVERARPSVVSVFTEMVTLDMVFGLSFEREEPGQGSGVIFDKQGYILTNNHVVEGARKVQVSLPDGRVFDAEVVGTDPPTDLAVIKIEGGHLPVAELGTLADLRVGDWVVAIGNPLGVGVSVTQGIVSALSRNISSQDNCQLANVIQTDAAINPGNSGGPLLDLDGRVIGINTAIARGAQGIGYAISIDEARPIIDYLIKRGRVPGGPYIGIWHYPVDRALAEGFRLAATEGLLVRRVVLNSSADRVGIQSGDVITHLDEQPLRATEDLKQALKTHQVGDKITLRVDRSGRTLEAELQLGESPSTCP